MIRSISIKNIALIEDLKIDFLDGLNIITGETGAGKSILLNSIGLVLGGKSGTEIVRSGEQKGSVEVVFYIENHPQLKIFLDDSGIEVDDDHVLIIKREVTNESRSRCFINLQSIPVSSLKIIGEYLLDISGQHDHQSLLRNQTHILLLDNYGQIKMPLIEFKKEFHELEEIKDKLDELNRSEEEKNHLYEMNQYAINEIDASQLQENEDSILEKELQTILQYEKLSSSLEKAYQYIYSDSSAVLSNTEKVIDELEKIIDLDDRLGKSLEDSKEALYLLESVKDTIRDFKDNLEYSPERVEEINERLDNIKDLKRKYGGTIPEILAHKDKCQIELEKITHDKELLDKLKSEVKAKEEKVGQLAIQLSKERQKRAKELEKEIERELTFLGMEKARFKIEFKYVQDEDSYLVINEKKVLVEANGVDRVEFKFSANPGESLKSLSKIASGGELSRVMLAIKTVLSEIDEIDSILFDEVDAGIGGEISIKVGKKIKEVSQSRQILCITHSPQIASFSDHHYYVEKIEQDGRTKTIIRKLNDEDKICEIARMLDGEKITDLSLQHAKELIQRTKT